MDHRPSTPSPQGPLKPELLRVAGWCLFFTCEPDESSELCYLRAEPLIWPGPCAVYQTRKIRRVSGIIQPAGGREDTETPTRASACDQHQTQSFLRGPLRVQVRPRSPAHGRLLSLFPHPGTVPVRPAFTHSNRAPGRAPARSDGGFENVLPVWPFMTRTPEWGGETQWLWGDPLGGSWKPQACSQPRDTAPLGEQ